MYYNKIISKNNSAGKNLRFFKNIYLDVYPSDELNTNKILVV